ncbi:Uncharacterised protein [uncultured archaeon]|nr:Uncharacterised protein [uncultured archaeon]
MQVGTRYSDASDGLRFNDKAVTLIFEIGLDEVATATSFIDYVSDKYDVSKSGAWYCLKKLKKEGMVEFTEKGESFKPLSLTPKGIEIFRSLRILSARAGMAASGVRASANPAPASEERVVAECLIK